MSDFHADWQAWHDEREEQLRNPQGWMAITAIHWLAEEPERFDDAPGAWSGDDDKATVELAEGETLTLESGEVLDKGTHEFGPLDMMGIKLGFESAVAQLASRPGGVILRPRHADSPNLRAYAGTPCYPPDEAWVIPARYEPYDTPDGDATGEVSFEHDGSEHRLVVWGEEDGSLWILFRDATSGVTTYAANRQMLADAPDDEGRTTLDFNRAINMPCAYTDFATCPLPPAANTLPFAVEAGEQIPSMSH